jgi:hypothetical protein
MCDDMCAHSPERPSDSSMSSSDVDGDSAPWYEFNDTYVSAFDPSTLPAAAFGGVENEGVFDVV